MQFSKVDPDEYPDDETDEDSDITEIAAAAEGVAPLDSLHELAEAAVALQANHSPLLLAEMLDEAACNPWASDAISAVQFVRPGITSRSMEALLLEEVLIVR